VWRERKKEERIGEDDDKIEKTECCSADTKETIAFDNIER
jgi:hypothetical protein